MACFSPDEFIAAALVGSLGREAVLWSLSPAATAAPLLWFADVVMVCERQGLLREPAFWTDLQRARPGRCAELHEFRRRYVANEPEPPRLAVVDAAVAAVARRYDTRVRMVGLLQQSGWRGDPPPAGSAVALMHWALLAVMRQGDGVTLFRLAASLRQHEPTMMEPAAVFERLAICACDQDVPEFLQAAWLDIAPDGEAGRMSFRAWEPAATLDGEATIDAGPTDRLLSTGLSLRVGMNRSGSALEIQLKAYCDGPWLGRTLRVCHGVHTFVRRLLSPSGDRLGDDHRMVLVLSESLERTEAL